jgi:HK97 gp10 family phage protein
MSDTFDMKLSFNLNIPGMKEEVKDVAQKAILLVAEEEVKPLAVSLSPVDTGTNRRSITVEEEEFDNQNRVGAKMFTTSGYGGYLEAGTFKMAARPYLYTAYEVRKKRFFQRIKQLWGG